MRALVKVNKESTNFTFKNMLVPSISDNEILVKVKAIGVGIQDAYFYADNAIYPYPIGMEGSGVVVRVGKNIVDFNASDRIAFVCVNEAQGGSYAEYTVLGEKSLIVKIPDEMSFNEAAAIPVSGNIMLKVINALNLEKGNTIFIAGASGSNGTLLIQLAKEIGCHIAASASKANHDYLKLLGVDKVVDYNDLYWPEQILEWRPEGVDVAISIQPNTSEFSLKVVRDNGKIISVSNDQFIKERNIEEVMLPYSMDVLEELKTLVKKIDNKEVIIHIEKVYKFNEALIALEKVSKRKARGKSIIELV